MNFKFDIFLRDEKKIPIAFLRGKFLKNLNTIFKKKKFPSITLKWFNSKHDNVSILYLKFHESIRWNREQIGCGERTWYSNSSVQVFCWNWQYRHEFQSAQAQRKTDGIHKRTTEKEKAAMTWCDVCVCVSDNDFGVSVHTVKRQPMWMNGDWTSENASLTPCMKQWEGETDKLNSKFSFAYSKKRYRCGGFVIFVLSTFYFVRMIHAPSAFVWNVRSFGRTVGWYVRLSWAATDVRLFYGHLFVSHWVYWADKNAIRSFEIQWNG